MTGEERKHDQGHPLGGEKDHLHHQHQAGGEQHEDQEQPPGGEHDHQPQHNLAGEEEGDISCNISMHIRMPGSKSQASQGGTSPMRDIKCKDSNNTQFIRRGAEAVKKDVRLK